MTNISQVYNRQTIGVGAGNWCCIGSERGCQNEACEKEATHGEDALGEISVERVEMEERMGK